MTDDCPHCAGEGTVWTPAPGSAFETARPCHRCAGTGQVECCAEQERVLTRLDYIKAHASVLDEMERYDELKVFRAASMLRETVAVIESLRAQNAALLAAHAEALERERWIPVGERLPEVHEDVLAWTGTGIWVASWFGNRWYTSSSSKALYVKHWRPLPAPPAPAPASAEGGAE